MTTGLTFVQRAMPDGRPESGWREAMAIPGKLRIDLARASLIPEP